MPPQISSADYPAAAESALEAIADEEAELEGGGDDGRR
jgi:hypothetical protein